MTLRKVVTDKARAPKAPKAHKVLTAALLLLAAAAAMVGGMAAWHHLSGTGTPLVRLIPAVAEAVAGLAWAAMGGVLAWLRPVNAIGWIMLGVGTLTQVGLAEEALANAGWYGVLDPGDPWQGRPAGVVLSAATGLAIYLMIGLLPVLYPSGRWPGRAWLMPAAAVTTGAVLLQAQWAAGVLAPAAPPAAGAEGLASTDGAHAWVVLVPGAVFAAGVLAVWTMCVVRLVRARQPERAQLLWLLATVAALLATQFAGGSIPGRWLLALCLYLFPAAIAVGIIRYRLLGIEAVLRRGLVYGLLTACIIAVYAAAMAAAGVQLTREPLVAVVGAALVAVGLSPLRTWLQRGVDVLLYGRRPDPMAAVSQLGALAAGAPEGELLQVVLSGVRQAVKAPYVRIVKPDGVTLAHVGGAAPATTDLETRDPKTREGAGPAAFTARLSLGSVLVGDLEVGGQTPGERYPGRDERLLRAMAPQLAAVVHALALASQVQEQRDAVLGAANRERARLRGDLHDGLGPSLTGVGLGLQALGDAVEGEQPQEMVALLHREITAAVADVRRILEDLAPAALADQSLAEALPQRMAAVAGHLRSTVDIAELPLLPLRLEETVYMVASEAVANAAKHSHATEVGIDVRLDVPGRTLLLAVHDDGEGVPENATPGFGLASMRERAAALGGSLAIHSSPNGTTVTLSLPLADTGAATPNTQASIRETIEAIPTTQEAVP